jgi:hypothetical protein
MKQKILMTILSLTLMLFFTTPALAQDGPDEGDRVVFGRDFTMQAEEKIEGNVVVFGGKVTIPAASEIDGDLVVFGGNADIDGTVTGHVGMMGGNLTLGETAVLEGDVSLVGGRLDRAKGATIEGQVEGFINDGQVTGDRGEAEEEGLDSPIPPTPPVAPAVPSIPAVHVEDSSPFNWLERVFDFFGYVAGNIAFFIALAVVSWLVATFMPEQMKVTGDTLIESAPASFGLGLLTAMLAPIVGLVLAITICLAFIPLLGGILLGIATLFGWIVAGQLIGERLMITSGRPYPNLAASTVLGVMVLTFIAKMPVIEMVPCLGWMLGALGVLLGIIVALAGLGAVILTHFGTRPYPLSPAPAFQTSPSPGPVPAPQEERPRPKYRPSPLDRSEAELRAKIKAALAEADAAAATQTDETPTEATPEENPSTETPAGEKEPANPDPNLPAAPELGSPSPGNDEPEK